MKASCNWKSIIWALLALTILIPLPVSGQVIVTVDNSSSTLTQIDLQTLAITSIGSLGVTFSYGDLAWNPYTSTLYMVQGLGGTNLYTVNLATGAATLVGSHGVSDMFGLAFDTQNSTLYGTSFNGTTLYSLDPTTGAATVIGNTSSVRIGALTFDTQRNMLIGVNDGSGNIYQVNTSTGALTLLASPGFTNDSGVAYDPTQDRLLDADVAGNLYSYDIAGGYARSALLTGIASHDGLVYLSSIPEPGTLALLAAGLGLLGARRFGWRRRGLTRGSRPSLAFLSH